MKKITHSLFASLLLFCMPLLAAAQLVPPNENDTGDLDKIGTGITNIITFINNTLIPFILALGFLAFVWGMFRYFIAGGANEEARESGRQLMIYAVLGFVLIVIFWGIVNLLAGSIFDTQTTADDVLNLKNVPVGN